MNDLIDKLLNGYWTGLVHAAVVVAALALPWARLDDEPHPITGIGLLYRVPAYADHAGDGQVATAIALALVITGSAAAFLNAKLRRRRGTASASVGATGVSLFPVLTAGMLEYPHVGWGVVLLAFGLVPALTGWQRRANAVGLVGGWARRLGQWNSSLRSFFQRSP